MRKSVVVTNLESAAADEATTAERERRAAADLPLAALYDTALLDLDGVVYRG